MSIEDDLATIRTAADGGNRQAQRALQAFTRTAAEAAADAAVTDEERGLAEVRRRYGPRPGDAA
jgi:glucokinase